MKRFHRRVRHSLSVKIFWLFMVMALMFVALMAAVIGYSFKKNFNDHVGPHVVHYLEYIQKDIGYPPNMESINALIDRFSVNVYLFDKQRQTWASGAAPITLSDIRYQHEFERSGIHYAKAKYDDMELFVIKQPEQTIIFSVEHEFDGAAYKHFLPVILVLILMAFFHHAARRIINPVYTIEAGVRRIGDGELDHRIPLDSKDELGMLANSINEMADDIQRMMDAKRQLLLAISHELRSPITRAKVSVAMLEDEQQKQEIDRDLQEVENLVEEILETERLSSRHSGLNKERVSIESLLRDVMNSYFANSGIEPELLADGVEGELDAARIKLLMKNLIANSLQHTPEGRPKPEVSVRCQGRAVVFTVKDYGNGIEEKHLPHLTEPFYRVDPSRRRETGGYGLGLYLCKVIAEAHGGSLKITSTPNEGTEVSVVMPMLSIS